MSKIPKLSSYSQGLGPFVQALSNFLFYFPFQLLDIIGPIIKKEVKILNFIKISIYMICGGW